MPPLSRRALLATAAAGTAGSVAGCSAFLDESSTTSTPRHGLENRTLHAADGVSIPRVGGLDRTADPSNADVAVFPTDADVETLVSALQEGTVTAVVGTDAQATLMDVCASDGRSYGFARNSWHPEPAVVAANPGDDHLDTHLFVGLDLPDDLPWALGEAFATAGSACGFREGSSDAPEWIEDRTRPVGTSRIRGLNDVGGFDRWDRVSATPLPDGAGYLVEMTGTIFAGSAARQPSDYTSDQVRLVTHFDEQVEYTRLGTGDIPADTLQIEDRTERSEGVAELAVTSENGAARQSFTACQRAAVTTETAAESFGYIGNGRFRWRKSGLFDDDLWHHHTPGAAVWYPHW
jgi:hypothetical protein